jgi:hypothetical protein
MEMETKLMAMKYDSGEAGCLLTLIETLEGIESNISI